MSKDNLKGFDEETKKQIQSWKLISREAHGADTYSKAQFNLGDVYFQHNKIEEAIEYFNNIKRIDNPELYAQIKIDLGIIAKKNGSVSGAINEWKKVKREDNREAYVIAQHYISDLLREMGDLAGALECLRSIRREDNIDIYTKAQLNIGEILHTLKDSAGAIKACQNIKRADSPSNFALAQTNIGNILHIQGKVKEAIEYWSNILPTDDAKLYANAQYNIGYEIYQDGDFEKALDIWREIKRSDNPEIYAITNFNIGAILREAGNDEGAINTWKNVERTDNPESYAKAKFSIGIILSEKGKSNEALIVWNEIKTTDSPEIYAQAQYNIGCKLKESGDVNGALSAWEKVKRIDNPKIFGQAKVKAGFLLELEQGNDEAIAMWSKIKREDNAEAYAIAQSNIGYLLVDNNPCLAKKAWENIVQLDDPMIYAHVQFKLGLLYTNERDTKKAKKCFKVSESIFPFESYWYIKIIEFLDDSSHDNLGQLLLKLLDEVLNIVNILTLDFSKYEDEEKPFERKLAHYTGTSTVNLLLAEDDKSTFPSPFRLNTINNVNDPSEGQILINKLKGINNKIFKIAKFNEEFHAFISCFTFNHDSLNQFRLYGKQDNKEASGMSLVFKKDFFQSKNFIGGLSFLSLSSSSIKTSELFSISNQIKSIPLDKKSKETKSVHNKIGKKPIMRCVYMDPTSEYIHVAQRSRLTFYREFGENTIYKDGKKVSQANYEWELYKEYIDKVTVNFSKAFSDLKTIFKSLEREIEAISKTEEKAIIEELVSYVDQILLPLKYLVKHSAFREEEECRMIYITSINSPEVLMQYGKFLYVEYEPKVKSHLDKVYIAPVATQYHPYLAKLLSGTDVKIELSGNPYRQT